MVPPIRRDLSLCSWSSRPLLLSNPLNQYAHVSPAPSNSKSIESEPPHYKQHPNSNLTLRFFTNVSSILVSARKADPISANLNFSPPSFDYTTRTSPHLGKAALCLHRHQKPICSHQMKQIYDHKRLRSNTPREFFLSLSILRVHDQQLHLVCTPIIPRLPCVQIQSLQSDILQT
jgi:hypothetical protein